MHYRSFDIHHRSFDIHHRSFDIHHRSYDIHHRSYDMHYRSYLILDEGVDNRLENKLHDQSRNSVHHRHQKNAFSRLVFMGVDV